MPNCSQNSFIKHQNDTSHWAQEKDRKHTMKTIKDRPKISKGNFRSHKRKRIKKITAFGK